MCGKPTKSPVPSDAQAREKLALYVYEYLRHVGAHQAAQTFLSEIRWDKAITLGESPGFLHSWWCVFWDLYSAAPERRDQSDHTTEAKAFHDYGIRNTGHGTVSYIGPATSPGFAPSPIGQLPPNGGMPGGPMPPNRFPNSEPSLRFMRPTHPAHPASQQQSPHPQMNAQRAPFNDLTPGAYGMRGPPPGSLRMPRAGVHQMNAPRAHSFGAPTQGAYGMRGPPPGAPGMMPGMGMGNGGRPQWQPNTTTSMNYASPSPGNYGSPMMHSLQDSSNSGAGNMGGMHEIKQEFPMGSSNNRNPMGQMGNPNSMGNVLNGSDLDGMKKSPGSGPGMAGDNGNGSSLSDYNLDSFVGSGENDQNESAAIFEITQSIKEEAKGFELDFN